MAKVLALLVGINEYVNVKPLHGCVDDVNAIEALLTTRVSDALQARKLLNGDATRAAIIDGFRNHLAKAAPGDVALFYYCGHGSQEPCPPEWMVLEPSGMNQTIVPVDARSNGVFDIADKELITLIQQVSDTGAEVVTIFDSCHSGGVTRDADEDLATASVSRMAPVADGSKRTLADYLDDAVTLFAPERIATQGHPEPTHITLSACQHFETAKEWPVQPPRRGTFTRALEEVLTSLGPSATYVDLLRSVRAKVRTRATDQVPLLTVSGKANGAGLFMGGRAGRRDLTIDIDDHGTIWISAGTADGIGEVKAGATTEIAIHRRGALDDPAAVPTPIATATVAEALVDRSKLRLTGNVTLDPAQPYIGVITKLGTPQMTVAVTGAPDAVVSIMRDALVQRSGLYAVAETPMPGVPHITARVTDDATELLDGAGVALKDQRFPHDTEGTRRMISAVVHLAKWYGTRDRTPVTSSLNDAVKIEVVSVAENETIVPDDRKALPLTDGSVEVKYTSSEGGRARIRLRNTSPLRLYVALVDLSESFKCSVWFNDWIPGSSTAYAHSGKTLRFSVPSWKGPDATACTDILKAFVATSPIEANELVLESLLAPKETAITRDIEMEEDQDSSFWGTTTLPVTTRR